MIDVGLLVLANGDAYDVLCLTYLMNLLFRLVDARTTYADRNCRNDSDTVRKFQIRQRGHLHPPNKNMLEQTNGIKMDQVYGVLNPLRFPVADLFSLL